MANALIAFRNRIDASVLSGGGWLPTLPLSNLKEREPGIVARSLNAANVNTKFDVDMQVGRAVRVHALVNHNFSPTAQFQLLGATEPTFSAPDYDSGIRPVWPSVFTTMELNFDDENWFDGTWTTEQKAGYTWSLPVILPAAIALRYWRWLVYDADNPAGYIQIGRPFMADAWQPAVNIAYPESLQWEDATEIDESKGGTEYFEIGPKRRVARVTTDWMSEQEAMRAFDIQRMVGTHDEVFYVYDPDDLEHSLRRQFLCRIRQLSPVEHTQLLVRKTAWELRELI